MKRKCFALRELLLIASVFLCLPGVPLSLSGPNQGLDISSLWNHLPGSSRTQMPAASAGMPGEAPVFADLDGDRKVDVAAARLSGNGYKIFLWLSTRSETTVLDPSVSLAGFRVSVRDCNNDSFQDIVVTTITSNHPLAVWHGDGRGNFQKAEGNLVTDGLTFDEPSTYQSGRISPDQEFLCETRDPVCAKVALLNTNPALELKGSIPLLRDSFILPAVYIPVTPRSPPPDARACDRALLASMS